MQKKRWNKLTTTDFISLSCIRIIYVNVLNINKENHGYRHALDISTCIYNILSPTSHTITCPTRVNFNVITLIQVLSQIPVLLKLHNQKYVTTTNVCMHATREVAPYLNTSLFLQCFQCQFSPIIQFVTGWQTMKPSPLENTSTRQTFSEVFCSEYKQDSSLYEIWELFLLFCLYNHVSYCFTIFLLNLNFKTNLQILQ